jgi:hypothetical protein
MSETNVLFNSFPAGLLRQVQDVKQQQLLQDAMASHHERYKLIFKTRFGFEDDELKYYKKLYDDSVDKLRGVIRTTLGTAAKDSPLMKIIDDYMRLYPDLYLRLIPREVIRAKVDKKAREQNRTMREKFSEIASAFTNMAQKLAEVNGVIAVDPFTAVIQNTIPDPSVLVHNPQIHMYTVAAGIFNVLSYPPTDLLTTEGADLRAAIDNFFNREDPEFVKLHGIVVGSTKSMFKEPKYGSGLLDIVSLHPKFTDCLLSLANGTGTSALLLIKAIGYDAAGGNDEKLGLFKKSVEFVKNAQTKGGCQPYGNEYEHYGDKNWREPVENPSMCTAEQIKPGNPYHPKGRNELYRVVRDESGRFRWKKIGVVPTAIAGYPVGAPKEMAFQPLFDERDHDYGRALPLPSSQTSMGQARSVIDDLYGEQRRRKSKKSKSGSKSKKSGSKSKKSKSKSRSSALF